MFLFNDKLNIFIYGYIVKYHSGEGKHTHYFMAAKDWQQEIFYLNHPTDRIVHNTASVIPFVENWLEGEIDKSFKFKWDVVALYPPS